MLFPTAYLTRLRDLLRATEPELWAFFASAPRVSALVDEVRAHLVRTTYRLDEPSHPEAASAASKAAGALGLSDPVTLYQSQDSEQRNATCLSVPGEAHVVFSGQLLDLLDGDELTAILGHELAHHVLWSQDGGDFWILDRLIHSSADDLGATVAHVETARLVRLNTELVADRGALLAVAGDLHVAVSALVKMTTGLASVSPESYLAQADEVISTSRPASAADPQSHPENFFRAWALAAWAADGEAADPRIQEQLVGTLELSRLDLLAQQDLTDISTRLVRQFLEPAWARTDPLIAHGRLFGETAVPGRKARTVRPVETNELRVMSDSVLEYVAYVLLDLATVDPEVFDVSLAASLSLSKQLGLTKEFDSVLRKELGTPVKDLRERRASATEILEAAGS